MCRLSLIALGCAPALACVTVCVTVCVTGGASRAAAQPAGEAAGRPSSAPSAPVEAAPAEPASPEPAEPASPEPASEPPAETPAVAPTNVSVDDEAAIRAALAADQASEPEPAAPPLAAPSGPAAFLQSMNPDISFIADFALAAFSSEDDNLQAGAHDPLKNGFNLQQLELSVGAAVDPYFRFDANIVFAQFGVEIEEAYATTLDLPEHLQLRAGQFLTRFGRTNPTHPHTWDFVDQPFAIGRLFGAEGNRGLGAELSWLSPLPWYVELVTSATDASGEATARSFYGPNNLGVDTPFDLQYTLAIKQFFPLSDDWSLAWGVSSATGPNGTGRANRSDVYGTDLYIKWRPVASQDLRMLSLHTEWFYRRRQVPQAVLQDVSGFASVMYRFARRWAVASRYDYGTAAVDANFEVASDYLDPEWDEARSRATVNTTFWPTEFSRVRVQGSVDLPGWLDDPIWAMFLAFEVVTGAHGAHAF